MARLTIGLALLLVGAAARASEDIPNAAVATAIVEAVESRIGRGFQVEVADLSARIVKPGTRIAAVPLAGARLSHPVRFALMTVPGPDEPRVRTRIGEAVARVRVTGVMVRAARPIARGHEIGRDDLVLQHGDTGDVPLGPLPSAAEAIGAQASRDITTGELLTPSLLRIPALVESGQIVTTIAVVGNVGVEGRAVASQRGTIGQIIRLVNPESRRILRGRVTGAARVEVLHEP